MTSERQLPEGLLLIDKPSGVTSHDAVDSVRRSLGTRKVGHAGTLDPMATGLLLLGVGRATRLLRFLGDLPKSYEGTMRLGVETTTLDADGQVTRDRPVRATEVGLRKAMAALVGDTLQVPPAFSAVRVAGRRLYEAARKGEDLRAEARPIHVESFELLGLRGADADFRVVCGAGTYVRVLAADVGAALDCGAHLTRLRRTRIGSFDVAQAQSPDAPGVPLPLERAVAHLPRLELDANETIAAGYGRILAPAGIAEPYGVYSPGGRLIGIYEDGPAKATPIVILAQPAGRPASPAEA